MSIANTQQLTVTATRFLSTEERVARLARQKSRYQDATKAMRLYASDNAAAQRGERQRPRMVDYVTDTWADGPREMEATEYAKSRFAEVPAKASKRN